jgi:Flp pilus assembly protein TadD
LTLTRSKEATVVLELDAELNPQSEWGRYLLGVAHATGNEKEKARTDFQKVLELNPKNGMAKKRLEALDKTNNNSDK